MTAKQERNARKVVNDALYELGRIYHDSLPITTIDGILQGAGLNETEPAIYCGREGSSNEQVGEHSYLSLSWYRMGSGRFEVTAYVS